MSDPTRSVPPSPLLFFDTVNAYQRTASLKAAVELNLFTAIAEGNATAAAAAGKCNASPRGIRILCDCLVVAGFLTKTGADANARYALTPDTALFLDRRSPAYLGGTLDLLLAPTITAGFNDLAAAVRKGGTVIPEEGNLAPNHPVWVQFARSMAPMMAKPSEELARLALARLPGQRQRTNVLDIAAGHGLFGLAFAKQNPSATVDALDWPNVLEVAAENARAAGHSNRFRPLPGSIFEVPLAPSAYDIILLPNFLHHFDAPGCEKILRKLHPALKPDGLIATLEFIPDESRTAPPMSATFALMMLSNTPAGDAYTFPEYEQMFRRAGFVRNTMHELPGTVQRAILSFK